MSASNDDDTLFSQDDIDKLLNAQSIEEAEESIAQSGGSGDSDNDASSSDLSADDLIGELSQDDIDRLLNASLASDEPEQPSSDEKIVENDEDEEDEDDDLGELSQDDIDRLLNSRTTDNQNNSTLRKATTEDKLDKNGGEENEDADAFDLISQDDIDKLMSTDDMSIAQLSDSEDTVDLNLDELGEQLGIDELDSSSSLDEFSSLNATTQDTISEEEEVIDPSDAWNVQDFLITQDTLDNLLNEPLDDVDISDSEQFNRSTEPLADDSFKVNLTEEEPSFDIGSSDDISSSDLDKLLNDTAEDMDDLLNDISQDDIDGFLKDSDENITISEDQNQESISNAIGGDDSVRNVISQDDIDALLSGTEEEDEDILADMEMDEDLKGTASQVSSVESALPEDDAAQVILEEPEESDSTLAEGTVRQLDDIKEMAEEKPSKRRFLLKVIIFILLFITIMAGCVAGVYFMFFKDKVDQLLSSPQQSLQGQDAIELKDKVTDINIQESQEMTPGNILLESFIIFTPNRRDGIHYISLDISINYSNSKVFDAINNKLPFYRGVIYDSIDNALKSDRGDRLTESELLEIVKQALNQSLPDMKLDKVVFVNFKTG